MSLEPRLVLAERTEEGDSALGREEAVSSIEVGAIPGTQVFLAWGTEDGGATVGRGSRPPIVSPVYPGPGGTRAIYVRWEGGAAEAEPMGDPEELAAEAAAALPGMLDAFEPEAPGMHTTDTIDYGICLEGELLLELDDGRTVSVTPGTCVVQQGTRHAWHVQGDGPALMCFVIVGARRES